MRTGNCAHAATREENAKPADLGKKKRSFDTSLHSIILKKSYISFSLRLSCIYIAINNGSLNKFHKKWKFRALS